MLIANLLCNVHSTYGLNTFTFLIEYKKLMDFVEKTLLSTTFPMCYHSVRCSLIYLVFGTANCVNLISVSLDRYH